MRSTTPLLALPLLLAACSDPPATPAPDAAPDVAAPDVATSDITAPDVVTDTQAPDVEAPDAVVAMDATPDVATPMDVARDEAAPMDAAPDVAPPMDTPAPQDTQPLDVVRPPDVAPDVTVSCPAGTQRTGDRCVDVDECATDNGGCGEAGVFTCTNLEAMPPRCTYDGSRDHAALTEGVRTINLGSALASALVVHGASAIPVVYDANHATFVAAARAGAGRVMEWGHEGLLENPRNTTDDRGRLALNAARWMVRGRPGAVIGIDGGRTELRDFLTANGFTVRNTTLADLDSVQVWITGADTARTPAEAARIAAWVRAGGGLMMGGHAWYWGYSNTNVAENFPGNRTLRDLGLTLTTDNDPQNNTAVTVRAPTDLDHAVRALERVRDHTRAMPALSLADQVVASATVRRGVRFEPLASPYFDNVRALRGMLPDVIPTSAAPVRPATQPIAALTVTIDTRIAQDTPPAMLRAHPATADFPGALPAGATPMRVTRTIDFTYAGRTNRLGGNSDRPLWRSTGLYAPPGARVTVSLPPAVVRAGVSVLVGSWTDDNFSTDAWTRMPVVTRSFEANVPMIEVGSAYGGLVYVRVPAGVSLGPLPVTFEGVVPAPRFVLGETSDADWVNAQRALPGPWAELETRKMVLTVPSSTVRSLAEPGALMSFWDRVMDADADLAAIPRDRPRAERIVFDRQIVAGYMHAGYPIMAHVPQAPDAVNLATLRTSGDWGFFHEIGHNHQFADWSWSGTGECTVNIWSVYAMQHASGRAPLTGHPAITPTERQRRIDQYIAGGRNWSRDHSVWTCLETFLQLQEGFGWSLFLTLDRDYMALAEADRPRTESERIQQWVIRSSRVANRNLAPFYTAWGFPLTDATRAAVSSLPAWTANPMR